MNSPTPLLHHLFDETAARTPDAVALVCGPERFRYRDLNTLAARLAARLARCGVRRGDRVVALLPNGPALVIGLIATLRVGGVFVPLSPQLRAAKLRYIVQDARPACLLTDETLWASWQPLAGELQWLQVLLAGEIFTAAEAPDLPELPELPELIDQDLAALIYTSGTTAEPKGVMLTHLNMISAVRSVGAYLGLTAADRIFCALPLSFGYGLSQVLLAFQVGAQVVLERSFAFPVRALERMEQEGVTVLPGVPTMFAALLSLDCLDRFPLAALRMLTNAGAALPEAQLQELRRRFPGARLFSMYGLTECQRASFLPPEELARRPGSVGRGIPNQECYLVDEAGQRMPLPPGPGLSPVGELVVRGSQVMRGYWNKPEETTRWLRPSPSIPGELVLHTGDLFRWDAEGFLYFVGRRDEIFKSRGERVSPREVEDALCSLDGVLEAAVFGVPDPLLGQAVAAYLVLRPGCTYVRQDVLRYCATRLEGHLLPKVVEFVSTLPKNANSKTDKAALRQQHR